MTIFTYHQQGFPKHQEHCWCSFCQYSGTGRIMTRISNFIFLNWRLISSAKIPSVLLALKKIFSPSSLISQCLLSDSPVEGPLIFNPNGHWYWVAGGVGDILWNFVRIGLTADAGDNCKNRKPIPLAPYLILISIAIPGNKLLCLTS